MNKSAKAALCAVLTAVFVTIFAAAPFAAQFPESYRTNAETPVLNQRSNPLCWAYAGSDLLSISAIKSGQAEGGAPVFSAPMLARAEFDGSEHRHSHGNPWYKCYGGLDFALMAGISGKGLLPDRAYPTIESADAAPQSALYGTYAYIDRFAECDISELPRKDRTAKLKQWIVDYGAAACDAFIGEFNKVTGVAKTLAYDNTKPAHQIILVGWDDTKFTDTGTGAFIMKNTWGSGWGNGGYAYISYNTDFGRTAYAASVRIDGDARVLSHTEVDYLTGNHVSASDARYGAVNVFKITEKLTLRSVGAYSADSGAEFRICVFVNPGNIASVAYASPDARAEFKAGDAGYVTHALDREINVRPGDTVAVMYLINVKGYYHVYSDYSDPDFELAVTYCGEGQSYTITNDELKPSTKNYIGTLIGFAEHKDPPAPETTVTETTAPETTTVTVPATSPDPVTEEPGTEPDTLNGETETDTDTGVFIPVTAGTGTDAEQTDPEQTLDLGGLAGAAKKLIKVVLTVAAIAAAAVILLVLVLIAASKKKKQ